MTYPQPVQPTRPRRRSALAVLATQLALTTLLPIAEARADADADPTVHVEATSSRPCAPGHDHMACTFCRVLAAKAVEARDPSRVTASKLVLPIDCWDASAAYRSILNDAGVKARAPPLPTLGLLRAVG